MQKPTLYSPSNLQSSCCLFARRWFFPQLGSSCSSSPGGWAPRCQELMSDAVQITLLLGRAGEDARGVTTGPSCADPMASAA